MIPSRPSFIPRETVHHYALALPLVIMAVCGFTDACAQTSAPAHAAPPAPRYTQRAEVKAFIDELVRDEGFDRREVTHWLAAARFQPKVLAAMERPVVAPPKWYEFAPPFLGIERVAQGIAFAKVHHDALARAEETYGVPAEIIVAILGVETFYGRNTGSYRTIDALTTLAFDYPRRASFFRGELKEFLRLAREQRLSPLEPRGSYAGALGIPQFMPGSVRRYAVDFDGDGRIDLWHDDDDAIGSVANYLARHDWLRGQPILAPAEIEDAHRDDVDRKLDGGISERRALAAWALDGVTVQASTTPSPELVPDPVGIVMLEDAPVDGAESVRYFVAFPNFYVLTRYNRSRLYAAAVFFLADAIKSAQSDP